MNALERDTLEGFIDRHGLPEVLSALAQICYDKAEHLRSAWNDVKAAELWEFAAEAVESTSTEDDVLRTGGQL